MLLKEWRKDLLERIKSRGLLSKDEIIHYYLENIQSTDQKETEYCKVETWTDPEGNKKPVFSHGYTDYTYDEIKAKAIQWYQKALGGFVYRGELKIYIKRHTYKGE